MIPTYILIKVGKAEPQHAKTISAILLYISCTCMVFNSFQKIKFDWDILGKIFIFFLVSNILLILDIVICYLILRKKYNQPKYRILTIASVFGNVGFLGLPVISGLYPESSIVVCYSSIYSSSMTILGLSIGIYALTLNKKYMSLYQTLYNQDSISIGLAVIIYLTEWVFPKVLGDAVFISQDEYTIMYANIRNEISYSKLLLIYLKDLLFMLLVYLNYLFSHRYLI